MLQIFAKTYMTATRRPISPSAAQGEEALPRLNAAALHGARAAGRPDREHA